MESGISATTPLFIHDDNFISPTKPLEISSHNYQEYTTAVTRHSYNNTRQSLNNISVNSVSSASNNSFKTAQSMELDEEDLKNDALYTEPVNAWSHEDTISDTTPIVRNEILHMDDILTPKAPEEDITVGSVGSQDDNSGFGPISREPHAGLGLAGRHSTISISSILETANTAKVISARSSPVKAIRTSMIINGQIDCASLEKNPDNVAQRNLYNVSYNDKSFVGDKAKEIKGLERQNTTKKSSELNLNDENFAYLFIIAIHSFNAESLDNQEDVSICLSFEKDDVAFVHTVDESGWGEVTLIRNRKRGWVPFNYFSDTVKSESSSNSETDNLNQMIETRSPLQKLLSACARFLLHPQDTPLPDNSGMTFNVDYVNAVRDGVKAILELTECVSRSNEIVQQRPIVRKARKQLLANWYNLMIKADYHKHTTSVKNIDTLMNLIFEVINEAFAFFKIWSVEKKSLEDEKEMGENKIVTTAETCQNSSDQYTEQAQKMLYLDEPPSAMKRLHEVYDLLFAYVGLILGRLDMIEHNPSGGEALESIVHQMIILLRELLYISKSCSAIIQDKYQYAYENTLHRNLDPLLSLVSELVSCVKALITQTLHDEYNVENRKLLIKEDLYHHTDQGERLTDIVSNMTTLISNSINGCNSYLRLIGDFPLGGDRQYLDLKKIKMTPEKFIEKCSLGLTKNVDKKKLIETLNEARQNQGGAQDTYNKIARFSTIRAGSDDMLGFTFQGSQFLEELFLDQKPFARDSTFEPFKPDTNDDKTLKKEDNSINDKETMQNELTFGKDGGMLGASFRALVFKLTDELDKPDDFFIASFLLNFRSFGGAIDLIDGLVSRFDLTNKFFEFDHGEKNVQYSSRSSRMKNRRKLVCQVFQTWMESYWDYTKDRQHLPTMINFFNEGVSLYLPIQTKSLIETAARLCALGPTSKAYRKGPKIRNQLAPKTIQQPKTSSIYSDMSSSSLSSRSSLFSLDEKIIEDYELTHVPSRRTSSLSLPLPVLNLGTSSLLSKRNIQDMENLINLYRSKVGKSILNTKSKEFIPKNDTQLLIEEWVQLISNSNHSPDSFIHNDMNLADLNPLELAKQLTLIESQLFLAIQPSELLDGNFLPKNLPLGLSPNVNAVLNFTNELSNYVIESILQPRLSLKSRTGRLKAWLKIALSTLYFRNYNSVASVMTALQNHAVTRCVAIWNALGKKEIELYEYLSRIIHPNNNFKVYRKKLQRYMEETPFGNLQMAKSPVPVVPFFNLYLQDLTFIYEGNNTFRNPDSFRPHKLVNIDKFFKVTKTINKVSYFQVAYEINDESTENLNSFFNLTDQLDVDTKNIKSIPLLQEFILYEFWRVNVLYAADKDRGYQLSLQLLPRT